MSLPRLSTRNHPLYRVFQEVDGLLVRFKETQGKRGRPPKFSDAVMVKCLVYQVFYRIRSFRELEWKLRKDLWARKVIGLDDVPDHSTLFRRSCLLEQEKFYDLFQILLSELEPKKRICYMDSTALRSSRYDRDAEKGKGTRLGWYYGYKLHAIVSEDLIPLVWDLSPANFYDNQFGHIMMGLKDQNVFYLLADAAYDDKKLFDQSKEISVNLVTQVNMRRASSPESFREFCRWQNWYMVNHGLGKKLLSKRSGIERWFALLKTNYGLEQPCLFGISRYYRHVLWVIIVYLLDRLIDKQQACDTRKAPWNR